MAFQELLRVRSVKHVKQKAFDGGVSHRGFPGCVDCILGVYLVDRAAELSGVLLSGEVSSQAFPSAARCKLTIPLRARIRKIQHRADLLTEYDKPCATPGLLTLLITM